MPNFKKLCIPLGQLVIRLIRLIHKRTWVSLGLLALLLPIVIIALYRPSSPEAAWFDDSYSYRRKITFTHNADINEQRRLSVTIDTATLTTAKMQADCDDTRFTDINGKSLKFQEVSGCDTASTQYDIVVDKVFSGENVLYIYYGNPSALNASEDVSSVTSLSPSGGTPTFASEETTPGPIAYWSFDEGQGQTVNDSTSNNNDGNITGAAWKTDDICISGKCLYFDGSGDYINSIRPNLRVNGSQTHTISLWFKTGASSSGPLLMWGDSNALDSSGSADGAIGWRGGTGNFSVSMHNATTHVYADAATSYRDNRWHLLTSILDGASLKLYVDGVYITENSNVNTSTVYAYSSNPYLWIGTRSKASSLDSDDVQYYSGFLDEVRIYNYARSADQIKQDYNKGAVVLGMADQSFLSDGLVGYWKMDEASGNATDSSGNSLTLTNNGTTTYVGGKFGSGSEHVPASSQYLSTASTISGVKTVSFWANPDSSTNYYISLTSGAYITSSSGTISTTGFTNPKIYINGQQSSTIAANTWSLVTVTSDTSLNANQFYVGRQGSNYYDGTLDEVRVYNRALSADEVKALYQWAPGPVGYWKFDEGSGTSAVDSSGYGKNGTITGTTWTDGKYGKALSFDGSGDRVTGFDTGNMSQFTASAWVNTTSTSLMNVVSGGNAAWYPSIQSGNVRWYDGNSWRISTATVNDGNWHYVTYVFNNGAHYIYVDGKLDYNNTAGNGTYTVGNITYIGDITNNARTFNGKIDEVKIYNYARTPEQILQDMQGDGLASNSKLPTPIAHYAFDEGNGQITNNKSPIGGSALNGTLGASASSASDDPQWKTKSDCKINGCLSFDGGDYTSFSSPQSLANSSFSVSSWIYQNAGGNSEAIWFSQGSAATSNNTIALRYYSTGKIRFGFYNNDLDTPTGLINTGAWYHVTATFDNNTKARNIYINGELRASDTSASAFTGDTSTAVGKWVVAVNPQYWDGLIDEVKIYNVALSEDQVRQDMNAGSSLSFGTLGASEAASLSDGAGAPPVAHWKLDEKSGTTAYDSSGNGNNGTFTGNLTASNWTRGKVGSAVSFYGMSNSYINAGDPASGILDPGTNSFTVEAWVFLNSNPFSGRVVSKSFFSGSVGYTIQIDDSTGAIVFEAGNAGSKATEAFQVHNNVQAPTNTWIHVTGVVNKSTNQVMLYQNGVPQPLTKVSGSCGTVNGSVLDISGCTINATNSSDFTIGAHSGGSHVWPGMIDDVKIYNYARTPGQVAYDYNRGAPLAHWRMDECEGTTLHDSGGGGNHGTLTVTSTGGNTNGVGTCSSSTSAWGSGASGKHNSSIYLDGNGDYITIDDDDKFTFSNGITNLPFSVSTWIYPTSNTSRSIVSRIDSTSGNRKREFDLYLSSGGFLKFQVWDNDNGGYIGRQFSSSTFPTNQWSHVVAVYDGGTTSSSIKLYVNGVRRDSANDNGGTFTMIRNTTVSLQIGYYLDGGVQEEFAGKIDEVRIYSYALSESQIKQVYNNGAIYFGD